MQQILGCILLQKQKYVYLVEFAIQNIKLAFNLWDWFWLKNKTGRGSVCIYVTLRGVHVTLVAGKSNEYYMLYYSVICGLSSCMVLFHIIP